VDWLAAREAILEGSGAPRRCRRAARASSLSNGSARSEHTCPGEMSKSWRLVKLAEPGIVEIGIRSPILLVPVAAERRNTAGRFHTWQILRIHRDGALPLAVQLLSEHSLGQDDDWMNEIYPLWVAAHGIMIVTPVNWYQAPGPLKAMMDRWSAPTAAIPIRPRRMARTPRRRRRSTRGWPYPRHLARARCSASSCTATAWVGDIAPLAFRTG
jgi:hypothetical protein